MTTVKKRLMVLQNQNNGKFQKTDTNSGYPYDVDDPYDAKLWNREDVADIAHYLKLFPQYKLVEVKVEYRVVKQFNVEPPSQGKIT